MTPASSDSDSAFRMRPELTKKNPPGRAKALMSSESTTLMVKGTLASELRTRFCPIRFTYSVMTGSCVIRALDSTIMAYCLPILISVSYEYQSPMPLPEPGLPTLRLPMSSMSFLPLSWVAPGASCDGVVLAAESGGAVELWGAEGWVWTVESTGACADGVCDCGLSWATEGRARLALSRIAVATARARDFMGNSVALRCTHLAGDTSARIIRFVTPLSRVGFPDFHLDTKILQCV